jgi:hypothetical protein
MTEERQRYRWMGIYDFDLDATLVCTPSPEETITKVLSDLTAEPFIEGVP